MNELTQDLLKELFDYQNGKLYWKVKKVYHIKIGDLAGHLRKDGYRRIKINGKYYLAHRLIFLYHYGYIPKELDHINGDNSNNNINNLREVTHQENSMNRKKGKFYGGKSTSSKHKGVTWHKQHKKWMSQIRIDGKLKHLGYFTLEIDAAKAYNTAAIESFGEFAKINGWE